MTTKTMIPDNAIDQAKRTDLLTLVDGGSLRRVAGKEYEGPCPRCGGDDRFHVKPDGWFCRQCRPLDDAHGWHSPIDFVMWRDGVGFREAVAVLTGQSVSVRNRPETAGGRPSTAKPATDDPTPQPDWKRRAEAILEAAQRGLWAEGNAGADYLLGRGLEPDVWRQFGAGFAEYRGQAAIVLPWYGRHGLSALRYRYLMPPQGGPKIVSLPRSVFRGVVFGRNALSYVTPQITRQLTLVLCEGELNAMSVWQAHHEASVEVLSIGSESARVPDSVVAFAQQFRHVLVWMDKPDVARRLMAAIPGAHSISSPQGRDANDLLQAGTLAGLLAGARKRMCATDADREHLYWTLWDEQRIPGHRDAATQRVMAALKPQPA